MTRVSEIIKNFGFFITIFTPLFMSITGTAKQDDRGEGIVFFVEKITEPKRPIREFIVSRKEVDEKPEIVQLLGRYKNQNGVIVRLLEGGCPVDFRVAEDAAHDTQLRHYLTPNYN